MMWLLLSAAILTEVTATLLLRVASTGKRRWYVPVAVGYFLAFTLLTLTLEQGMNLGVAYGIWAALGVTLTVLLAAVLFGEALTPVMMVGVAMVIGGVLCVELGSHKEPAEEPAEEMVLS